ncbi:hypothetical protein [Natrinema salinisoli]|uniref:hypothetical protein n=1 Tax=Natrinema salinisoli TaxID=2878535 RepID=UPI001CEFCECC|nr:hypothetical protein [Natrinema salinisoli]
MRGNSTAPSRRALLGSTVGVIGPGCLGYVDNGPQCPFDPNPPENKTGAIDAWQFGLTSNNQRENGSCRRATATVCVEVSLEGIQPDRIDRVVAKNGDDEVVASTVVEDQNEVYLELAELSRGDTGEYTISVIRDGKTIEQGTMSVDCSNE